MSATVAAPPAALSSCQSTAGGNLELAALSDMDAFTVCGANDSLWVQAWRRITNYAIVRIDIQFQSSPSGQWAAGPYTAQVDAIGDLLTFAALRFEVSALAAPAAGAAATELAVQMWTPALGYAAIDSAELRLGGSCFETLRGEYCMMYDETHRAEGKRASKAIGDYGLYLRQAHANQIAVGAALKSSPSMQDEATFRAGIAFSTIAQEIIAPLPFHFAGHPGNAFNLVGQHRQKVEFVVNLRAQDDLVISGSIDRATGAFTPSAAALDAAAGRMISPAVILTHQVLLDGPERKYRATMPSTIFFIYPQEQQIPIAAGDAGLTKEVRSYLNHPIVNELFAFRAAAATSTPHFKRYFEFGVPSGFKTLCDRTVGALVYEPQEMIDPILSYSLNVNSNSRLETRPSYLRRVTPMLCGARVPDRLVYMQSFAQDATDESGPMGSFNASRVDSWIKSYSLRQVQGAPTNLVDNLERAAKIESSAVTPSGSGPAGVDALAGTMFVYHRTINFAKQQNGAMGKLFQ